MTSPDVYAIAKSNLRDNVKTLVAVFGGIAGVLLAGAPFTGYGALVEFSGRWISATLSLVLAVVFVGISIKLLLRMLEPDLVYQSALRQNFDITKFPKKEWREIQALRVEFLLHKGEILPTGIDWLDELESQADEAYERWQQTFLRASEDTSLSDYSKRLDAERKAFDDLNDSLSASNQWAAFVRLRYRVINGCNRAFLLGLVALFAIGVFSWSVGEKKKSECYSQEGCVSNKVVIFGASIAGIEGASQLPILNSIKFETGKWSMSTEGMIEAARARDYLRANMVMGVLLFAYTDTQGEQKANRLLAARRAEVVKSALIVEGGISASRIFVAELPETDLPMLTGKAVDSERNRAVQLILVPMPSRK